MSSQVAFSEEDLSCPVCRGVFRDPVILPCSHSFCKACLQEWWKQKDITQCPVCKRTNKRTHAPRNLALKNLCETFTKEKRRKMGPEEAAAEETLELLRKKLNAFTEVRANCDQTAEHIEAQTRNTERKIKEQFQELHRFLREDEEARIAALREEASKKSQMMKEKIEGLNRDIVTLSNDIRGVEEEEPRAEHVSFLQNCKTTADRVQLTLRDPQPVPGALIDEAKHLGNLAFRVWDRMKDIVSYTPVILDPNTAHPRLTLSDDLTSVRRGEVQQLPDNAERFDCRGYVLGSEGFNSGTHSWDVGVGDNAIWDIGVLSECQPRKGKTKPKSQYWKISGRCCMYIAESPSALLRLSVTQKPRRIRVRLDWDTGELSFSDLDSDARLHTFTDAFTDTLFPYLKNISSALPLKMLPREIGAI